MTGELNDAVIRALHEAWAAANVPPGPCPHTRIITGDRPLYALCDLRAGHDGQHEAESDEHGYYRWTDPTPDPGCSNTTIYRRPAHMPDETIRCELPTAHAGFHTCGLNRWGDCGNWAPCCD